MGSLALSPLGWAIAITVAGGLGAVLRLLLSRWHGGLPWGILAANTIASFLLGLFLNLDHSQFLVLSALAGGLSTFSTFAGQTSTLWSAGQRLRAAVNFVLNFGLPYTGVVFGAVLSVTLLK
jgi:CrcB protein